MNASAKLAHVEATLVNQSVLDHRASGRKVVGFFCAYVPEELLAAAGVLPYRVRPVGCSQTPLADSEMSSYNCSFAKSCLEYALMGKFEFLDGLVSMNSCDHIRRLYDVWSDRVPAGFMHFLSVPHKQGREAVLWYRQELLKLKTGLEEWLGVTISDEELRRAIETQNETRALLHRLYELRKATRPPLTGTQVHQAVLAATAMPKNEYNRLLAALIDEAASGPRRISNCRARLMVIGSSCDDVSFFEILEGSGGLVVTDALCFGARYFWQPVEVGDDLLMNLAASYLKRPACPRMVGDLETRMTFIKDLAQEYQVDGIVYQRMRNCDLWAGDGLALSKVTQEWGIPLLPLDRVYGPTGAARLQIRIEAFLESIEGLGGKI